MVTKDDHRLARALGQDAGQLLVRLRNQMLKDGVSGKELGAQGDAAAHALLIERLAMERPGDAVLSEEATRDEHADLSRLDAPRVWIIDPVDGTREYGEGRADWAVHVALVEDHVPTAGAVALPGLSLVLGTDDPPTLVAPANPPRIVVSRTRPPVEARHIADALGADLIGMGSAGAKAMAVVRGEAELYVHSGGQYEWDSCAPVAVAAACGLHVSRIDGSPLVYNQADVFLPDLLICRSELAQAALDAVAEAGS